MVEGVEGETGVGDAGGGGLGEDAAEPPAGEGRLRRVFSPDLDFVVGGRGGEVASEGAGDPLDLFGGRSDWGLAYVGGMMRVGFSFPLWKRTSTASAVR